MRSRIWMTALLGALAFVVSAGVARAQCVAPRNLPPLQIDIQVRQPVIVYHHDVDLFGLPKLKNHSERPPPGQVILGLTMINRQMAAQYQVASVRLADGRVCIWVGRIDAVLGSPQMNVYVAEEYAPDTCEYRVVLDHENTHVRFNLETLRDWAPTIKAALVEAARRKFPAIFPRPPSEADLNDYLLANMEDTFQLMGEDMARRNATIDTPENYRRTAALCHNWSRDGFKLDH